MPAARKIQAFAPHRYVGAYPPPRRSGSFVAPTYVRERTGELLLAPKAFVVALADGFVHDALAASEKTSHLVGHDKKVSAIKIGFETYSVKTLEVYHSALLHFLAWSEMRGIEARDPERFSFRNILNYRVASDHRYASVEDYQSDMMDKRRLYVRSSNPNVIRTRIMVANGFLAFCLAQGFRQSLFSPYLAKFGDAYLDRDELLPKAQKIPKVPPLADLTDSWPDAV